jgi:uncharacterized protein (DUF4415 family)
MRKQYDFSNAKRARDLPHLAELQSGVKGKSRITIMLDNVVLDAFRLKSEAEGVGYQTLINSALRSCLNGQAITEDSLRKVVREELAAYKP